jgi:hypothetical protein
VSSLSFGTKTVVFCPFSRHPGTTTASHISVTSTPRTLYAIGSPVMFLQIHSRCALAGSVSCRRKRSISLSVLCLHVPTVWTALAATGASTRTAPRLSCLPPPSATKYTQLFPAPNSLTAGSSELPNGQQQLHAGPYPHVCTVPPTPTAGGPSPAARGRFAARSSPPVPSCCRLLPSIATCWTGARGQAGLPNL